MLPSSKSLENYRYAKETQCMATCMLYEEMPMFHGMTSTG